MIEVRTDIVRVDKRVAEDVKLMNITVEQDLIELSAIVKERKRKSQTCVIA